MVIITAEKVINQFICKIYQYIEVENIYVRFNNIIKIKEGVVSILQK